MSLTVGFPNAAAIMIGGKSPATVGTLSDGASEAGAPLPGKEESGDNRVKAGGGAQDAATSETGSNQSIAVKMLLKRMQELQKQLREQQQQLAAAQVASYPTPEAKATAVMSIQSQIAETSAALAQVAGSLVKELVKNASSGGLISTTA
jgi:hypothetical protein